MVKKAFWSLFSFILIILCVSTSKAQINDIMQVNFSITGYLQFATDTTSALALADLGVDALSTLTIPPATQFDVANKKTGTAAWYYRSNIAGARSVTGSVTTTINGTSTIWGSKHLTGVYSAGTPGGATMNATAQDFAGVTGAMAQPFATGLSAQTVPDGVITFDFWYTEVLEPTGSWNIRITWTCN
jgi:hypothetical protein